MNLRHILPRVKVVKLCNTNNALILWMKDFRPVKDYSQKRQRTKLKEARKDHSLEELIHMAIQKASEDGNTDYLCIFF